MLDALTDEVLPALIARLRASRLAELEVRDSGWRVRLRRDLRDGPAPVTQPCAAMRDGAGERRAGGEPDPLAGRGLLQPGSGPRRGSRRDRRRHAGQRRRAGHRTGGHGPQRGHRQRASWPRSARPWSTGRCSSRSTRSAANWPERAARDGQRRRRTGRGARDDRPRPHRQPRRDRGPHPACLSQHGHRGRRRPQRGGSRRRAPCSWPTRPSASGRPSRPAPTCPRRRSSRRRSSAAATPSTRATASSPRTTPSPR